MRRSVKVWLKGRFRCDQVEGNMTHWIVDDEVNE